MFVTILLLAMMYLMVPNEHSKVLCDSESNSWAYNNCTTGVIIENLIKFAILNFCLLPRVVFIRTEEQVDNEVEKGKAPDTTAAATAKP